MDIFVFSSKNLTNIWAGIGAQMWAVSPTDDSSTAQGRKTKAAAMRVGSFGILYCVETHSLTTPFIVYSKADPDRIIDNVWPEKWVLPFRLLPLGNPNLQLSSDDAKSVLPIFKRQQTDNFGKVFHVQAVTAFAPTNLGADDWEQLIARLATEANQAGAITAIADTIDWMALD